jgi:hypothetical protein
LFEIAIFIRLIRLLTLLYEIETFRKIIETIKNLLGPFYSIVCVQFTLFYAFGLLGMFIFGGKVRSNSPEITRDDSIPDNYALNNFNDLASSFVTLFTLMVVNNWMVTATMYVDITGTNYTRFFFVAFYYFCVLIGLNIVIAFAIDMYGSVERLDQSLKEHQEKLYNLA